MRSQIAKSLSALFISLDPTKRRDKMATDAQGAYKSPEHIDLEVLRGSKAKQKYFLKIAPTLAKCWEEIEPTPTTKEMLRILKRASSIITKKLKHEQEIEGSRTDTGQDKTQEGLQ